MKFVFIFTAFLVSFATQAETCDLISGFYKTTKKECRYSHDGINFFEDGHKAITIVFREQSKNLDVTLAFGSEPVTLNYIADGKEHTGRPSFEGDKYVAQCQDNKINVRTETSFLNRPINYSYAITPEGGLFFKITVEGSGLTRICEMERF